MKKIRLGEAATEQILTANDYRLMFRNCTAVDFQPETKEEQVEVKTVTENVEFDGFDWDRDMDDAYLL